MRKSSGRSKVNLLLAVVVLAVAAAGIAAIAIAVRRTRRGQPSPYTYDLTEYRKVDPSLIVCREIGRPFETGFDHSRAIAVGPDGKVYVSGDQAVRLFDPLGRGAGRIDTAGAPGALAVDTDGSVYVAMAASGGRRWDHLAVYGADGARKAQWDSAGPNSFLTSVAVGADDVFVADAGGRVVLRYDKAGQLLGRIGRKDPDRGIPGLVIRSPYCDVAVGGDGLLRVANTGYHQIETYTAEGEWGTAWGEYTNGIEGFCGCCNPANFALLPAEPGGRGRFGGFVTAEKALTRVKIYGPEGKFVGVVAAPEVFKEHDRLGAGEPAGTPYRALDVAVDAAGRVLILDPYLNVVRTFERNKPKTPSTRPEP